ncbi:MAG: AAA family ATPase [Gammaproteobacteria bacterium]|nr:AAA family ATPase [Gammaproteobacteria bacterium]
MAPRPKTVGETGLSDQLLQELLLKHLYDGGTVTVRDLALRLALAGPVIEELLGFLRAEAMIEVRAQKEGVIGLRYVLTDRGRKSALDALLKSGYLGPAPVPLETYCRVCKAQSVHDGGITRQAMHQAFSDVVINPDLLDQLGSALNSGRAIFVYGPAGTGKTYITQRLARMINDCVLIPHAIEINEAIVQVFDPVLHEVATTADDSNGLLLGQGFDPRFQSCRRPVVITGGELTADMLEINYDKDTREYRAPLQLRANNGIFIIDDMGRQRVAPETILNRWIVPMEEGVDYHSLGSGRHFSTPFDVILVFSTNINPLDLADEAFLRRIGYKIKFDYLPPSTYKAIWQDQCEERGIAFDPALVEYAISELHQRNNVDLLPCHPRDLLTIAADRSFYLNQGTGLTKDHLVWAWKNYFVELDTPGV